MAKTEFEYVVTGRRDWVSWGSGDTLTDALKKCLDQLSLPGTIGCMKKANLQAWKYPKAWEVVIREDGGLTFPGHNVKEAQEKGLLTNIEM